MLSRTTLVSVMGIAALALSACSSSTGVPAPTPVYETSSSAVAPSPSATTASPSATTATPSPTAETPSPEPTVEQTTAEAAPTQTQTAPTEQASPASDAIAAPGTNCGPAASSAGTTPQGDIYVSGGSVSCAEAISVFNSYFPQIPDLAYNRYGVVEGILGGYTCQMNRQYAGAYAMLSGQAYLCRNSVNGAYLELRNPGERVLPGYVVDMNKHIGDPPGPVTGPAVTFSTPAQTVDCLGTLDTERITCRAFLAGGGINYVTMGKTGAPTFSDFSDGPTAPVQSTAVDVGTVITALGVSCKPTDTQTLYCVNTTHGFTLSPNGFVQD